MKSGAILGLALLAAFVAYCFTREEEATRAMERDGAGTARRAGDGGTHAARAPVIAHRHVHEGDPSVRH